MTNYAIGLNLAIFALVYFMSNIAESFALSLLLLVFAMKFVDRKKRFD